VSVSNVRVKGSRAEGVGEFDSQFAASRPCFNEFNGLGVLGHQNPLRVGPVLQAGWFRSFEAAVVPRIAAERIDDSIAAGDISVAVTVKAAVELAGPAKACIRDDGEEGASAEWLVWKSQHVCFAGGISDVRDG
jgi:hypothetical protein